MGYKRGEWCGVQWSQPWGHSLRISRLISCRRVTGLEQFPNLPGRQSKHFDPFLTHLQFTHLPLALHQQQGIANTGTYVTSRSNKVNHIDRELPPFFLMSTGTGVRQLRRGAFDRYGYGRTMGTGTGVPLERKRAYVRASKGNFIVTRTVYTTA